MFYVITRRTIRNVFLLIILLVVLISVLLSIDWRRPQANSGVVARSRLIASIKELFPRGRTARHASLLPVDVVEPSDSKLLENKSPTIVSTTVTIGDPWQWKEGDPLPSVAANLSSGHSVPSVEDSLQEALPAAGNSLRGPAASVVDVQPVNANKFAAFRLERDIARSRQLEYLHGVLNNQEVEQLDRQSAHEDLLKILKQAETETNIENLLLASGFSEAVVIIAQNGVSVVVNSVLSDNEAARIGNLVAKMAEVRPEDVRILDADGV